MSEDLKSPTSRTSQNPVTPDVAKQVAKQKKHGDIVLIAMDGSEYSGYALQFYMDTVHKPGNHVVIVHSTEYKCISFPEVGVMDGHPDIAIMTNQIATEESKSNECVEKLTKRLNHLKVDGEIARTHGEPGRAIITTAHEKHVDYIVIGCRGKGSVRRTFTGSVTDYVSHHSPVPVMIARHKDHLKHYHGFHLHNPFRHHMKHTKQG